MHRIWPFKTRLNGSNGKQRNHQSHTVEPNARPDFLCIGAKKAGTTWLYLQLAAHPDFWMPPLKELSYFDSMNRSRHPDRSARSKLRLRDERDRQFRDAMESLCTRQHIDLERYGQLFAPKGSLLSGDITPGYCVVPEEMIEQIVSHFPRLKVIFLARDPVERVWSDLSMAVRFGGIRSFDVTDIQEVTRNLLHPDIVIRSYSSKAVARWRRHVHPDLFRVYFFDDLETNPAQTRNSIIRFLGGDPAKPSGRVKPNHKINEGAKKLPLSEAVRSHVARFFEKELSDCAVELGGRAKEWPIRYGLWSLLWWLLQFASDCDFLAGC